jgi:hypothetical protein
MHSVQSQISIPASINDTARTLYINFTDGGDPYHISEGCTALLIISKPSRAKLSEWCAIKDNTNVIYPFSQNKNTASEEGICECEITLYSAPDEDGDIEQIASPRFSIVVSERAINRGDDEVLPETSIGFIDQAVKDELVRRQNEEGRVAAENARVSAETARAGAETARANAESARATAETERASAEGARASAETARASAETQRIAAEEERQRKAAEYKAQVDLVREEISTWQDEWGKISSFDKRLENLEAAVSPEIVTPVTDSTVAYSKTVPKGVLPNAAVTEIGGMSYRCENLINLVDASFNENGVTTTVKNQQVYFSGVATAPTWTTIGTVKLVAGDYTFSATDSLKVAVYLYHQSGNISLGISSNRKSFTISETRTYSIVLQISNLVDNSSTFGSFSLMLNRGTSALPYQPYFTGLRDSKVTAVESVGVNLIPFPYAFGNSIATNGVTVTANADGSITLNGTFTASQNVNVDLIAPYMILPAGTYRISGIPASGNPAGFVGIICNMSAELETYVFHHTFTTTEAKKFGLVIQLAVGSSFSNQTFYPMLNKGSTALPYSPYFRESLPIHADALDGFGQGVNAEYCNKIVIDPLEGVKKYVRAFKKIKLNDISWRGENSLFYGEPIGKGAIKRTASITEIPNMVIEKYTPTGAYYVVGAGTKTDKTICVYEGYLYVYDKSHSTVDAFLAASGDVELIYELATPTETDVSTLFADDNLLPVEAGGTITAVNEYEQAVPFSIEYTVKGA